MFRSHGLSTFYNKDLSISHIRNEGESIFSLNLDDGEALKIQSQLPFSDNNTSDYQTENYHFKFYVKKDVRESNIIELKTKPTPDEDPICTGFIIPLISLESDQHAYARKNHFLRYAYISIMELFKQYPSEKHLKPVDFDTLESISLSDIFDDNLVIVIVYNVVAKLDDFSRISPLLFQHGFIKLTDRTPNDIIYKKNETQEQFTKLNLVRTSNYISESLIIEKILHEQFPYEKNPAFKFFILYQIIELLIDKIYQHLQTKIIEDLIANRNDVSKSKDIISEVQKYSSEKKRIMLLFKKYSVKFDNREEFLNSCKITAKFLFANIKESKNEEVDYFYPIRNYIVHNYRKFPNGNDSNIETLSDDLINILPSLLSNYSESKIEGDKTEADEADEADEA